LTSRRRFLILASGILLIIVWFALPTSSVFPQDAPTLFPTGEGGGMLVALPFGDTFDDTPTQWKTTGAWRYDEEAGYEGGGWILDATQSNTESILEYIPFIDLQGTLDAQIMFRQRGHMSISDLIAVEISLDGGTTWFIVDSQGGLASSPGQENSSSAAAPPAAEAVTPGESGEIDDWILREISLSDYRNQVIRLRFRVETGVRFDQEMTDIFVFQIDNLSIQYVAEAPVYAQLISGPHTLLGLHLIVGARIEPVLDLVKRLRDAGFPMGTIKGTSGTEEILAAVAKASPETIIVYRSLETPRGMIDCANSFEDPVVEANAWMAGLWPEWEGVPADYFETTNECFPPIDWLVPFTIESMRLATERGYCLLVFSFAAGNPEPYQYDQLKPVYEYALQHPCQPGRLHGIALHVYSGGPDRLLSDSGIWLGLRYRLYYEQLLPELPEATRLPVFFTEAGPGDGRAPSPFTCADVTRDMIQYTQQLEEDPFIQGFHLWNVGAPTYHWVDMTECLPMLGDALINYYASK
jgi:hypothetical protein